MEYETVALDEQGGSVLVLDQTKLPGRAEIIRLHTAQEIWEAIYLLKVRGAPAIGVAAAFGIYVLAGQIAQGMGQGEGEEAFESFYRKFREQKEYLNSARPTARKWNGL